MVKDINPGPGNAYPSYFKVFNGKIYFQANNGINGSELWVTDGTAAGTQMVKDINPGAGNSSVYSYTEFNGKLYFTATNSAANYEMWVTDGTTAGTQMFKEIDLSLIHI